MNIEQLTFRNNLAVELVTTLLTKTPDYESSALVNHAFELANLTCTRITADSDKLIEELNAKAAKARAIRQAEFDELVGGIAACGSTAANTKQHDRRNPRQNPEATTPLRRAEDKVEVHEVSVEQALDMIASLFHAAKH